MSAKSRIINKMYIDFYLIKDKMHSNDDLMKPMGWRFRDNRDFRIRPKKRGSTTSATRT